MAEHVETIAIKIADQPQVQRLIGALAKWVSEVEDKGSVTAAERELLDACFAMSDDSN